MEYRGVGFKTQLSKTAASLAIHASPIRMGDGQRRFATADWNTLHRGTKSQKMRASCCVFFHPLILFGRFHNFCKTNQITRNKLNFPFWGENGETGNGQPSPSLGVLGWPWRLKGPSSQTGRWMVSGVAEWIYLRISILSRMANENNPWLGEGGENE